MRGERYRGIVFVSAGPSEGAPAWLAPVLANAGLERAEVACVALGESLAALAPKVLIAETAEVAARLREAYPETPVLQQARVRATGAEGDRERVRRAYELGLELRRLADGR